MMLCLAPGMKVMEECMAGTSNARLSGWWLLYSIHLWNLLFKTNIWFRRIWSEMTSGMRLVVIIDVSDLRVFFCQMLVFHLGGQVTL